MRTITGLIGALIGFVLMTAYALLRVVSAIAAMVCGIVLLLSAFSRHADQMKLWGYAAGLAAIVALIEVVPVMLFSPGRNRARLQTVQGRLSRVRGGYGRHRGFWTRLWHA